MVSIEKETYVSPSVLVVAVQSEGIVCASNGNGSGEGFTWE
jgi:hypothetical protein